MRVFQTNADGMTYVSQKNPKSENLILNVTKIIATAVIIVVATVVCGIYGLIAIGVIGLLGFLFKKMVEV